MSKTDIFISVADGQSSDIALGISDFRYECSFSLQIRAKFICKKGVL